MQSITSIAVKLKSFLDRHDWRRDAAVVLANLSAARRHWRPLAGVLAVVALAVAGLAQPWQHRPSTRSTAGVAVAAIQATPPAPKVSQKAKAPSPATVQTTVSLKTYGSAPHLKYPRMGSASISVLGAEPIGGKNSNLVRPTASVAKAMTAYIILKDHPLQPGWYGPRIRVTKAEAAALSGQIRQQQSTVPVVAGEMINERDALEALMLASANNMAQILARWDGGSVTKFVDKMNATAKQLGMTKTHYTDPSGFKASTKSTTNDQLRLAAAALKAPEYAHITSLRSAWIPVKGHIVNYNKLLAYPSVVGIKTGSMGASGGNLLFAAHYKMGGRWVVVLGSVFGQFGSAGILTVAFNSSADLLTSAHKSLRTYKIVWKGRVVGTVPGTKTKLVATKDVPLVGFSGMTVKGALSAKVAANTKPGAIVGKLNIAGTSVPVAVAK